MKLNGCELTVLISNLIDYLFAEKLIKTFYFLFLFILNKHFLQVI